MDGAARAGAGKETPSAGARCLAGSMGRSAANHAAIIHGCYFVSSACREGLTGKFTEVCAASKAEYQIKVDVREAVAGLL